MNKSISLGAIILASLSLVNCYDWRDDYYHPTHSYYNPPPPAHVDVHYHHHHVKPAPPKPKPQAKPAPKPKPQAKPTPKPKLQTKPIGKPHGVDKDKPKKETPKNAPKPPKR
ncbi:MAG: hypothetical protein Q4C05_02940 [Akkermansia sp.]|nr:hypothetical protein [Akkermansia sp.]